MLSYMTFVNSARDHSGTTLAHFFFFLNFQNIYYLTFTLKCQELFGTLRIKILISMVGK